jgi:hypothetical protein
MGKSKVYHDITPSFGLCQILSEEQREKLGLPPPFEGGPMGNRFQLVTLVDSDCLEEIFSLTNTIDHARTENEKVIPMGLNTVPLP